MRVPTTLPFLTLFFFALVACGGTVTGVDGGTGVGGGSGGTGGGEDFPACGMPAELPVFAYVCYPNAEPVGSSPFGPDYAYAGAVTVAAVYTAFTYECSSKPFVTEGELAKAPEALIRVVDPQGTTLTLGVAAPGFSSSGIAVGDTLDIDFASGVDGTELHKDQVLRLRIERGGELLVAVGANDPIGLSFEEGARECFGVSYELPGCGQRNVVMQVQDAQGNTVSIPNGASAEIDGRLVTNARYIEYFDIPGGNGCTFGLPVEHLVSAVPIP